MILAVLERAVELRKIINRFKYLHETIMNAEPTASAVVGVLEDVQYDMAMGYVSVTDTEIIANATTSMLCALERAVSNVIYRLNIEFDEL